MSDFGNRPAHPEPVLYDGIREQINMGGAYFDVGGISIAQHVYLTLYAAVEAASPNETKHDVVDAYVKARLPLVLESMEKLHGQ